MGDDLESTLAALFTGTKNAAPVVTKGAPRPQRLSWLLRREQDRHEPCLAT
jgi:hypothetical protein